MDDEEILKSLMADNNSSQNKVLSFTLLRQRPIYLRLDVLSVPIIAGSYYYTFGDKMHDVEHILASVMLIVAVTLICLVFLMNYWNVNANVIMGFSTLNGA